MNLKNFRDMPHDKVIWRVDVSDEYLTFTVEERPLDFMEKSEALPYEELNGTYCGHRGFEDQTFQLVRRLKASNFYSGYCGQQTAYPDQYGNFSLYNWRTAHGYGYAWEPSTFYKYDGKLYTTHINFR